MKKIIRKFSLPIGYKILPSLMTMLCSSLRIKHSSDFDLGIFPNGCVLAFWHGTMIVPWYIFRNKKVNALVSQSKDGELLTNILMKWGYVIHRGSSNKGGKEAFEKMISEKKNHSVAITPDGPTGPAKKFKAGAVIASKKTSTPLVLIGVKINKKLILKSWDKFEIPFPFSRVTINYADPINVDETLSYEETSEEIKNSEQILNSL